MIKFLKLHTVDAPNCVPVQWNLSKIINILLMEEILHQLTGRLSHYLQGFSTIPGGDRWISEPSTVGSTWMTGYPTSIAPWGPPETFTRRIRACAQKGGGKRWGIFPHEMVREFSWNKKTKNIEFGPYQRTLPSKLPGDFAANFLQDDMKSSPKYHHVIHKACFSSWYIKSNNPHLTDTQWGWCQRGCFEMSWWGSLEVKYVLLFNVFLLTTGGNLFIYGRLRVFWHSFCPDPQNLTSKSSPPNAITIFQAGAWAEALKILAELQQEDQAELIQSWFGLLWFWEPLPFPWQIQRSAGKNNCSFSWWKMMRWPE